MKRALNTAVTLVLLTTYLHLGVVGHLIRWTANAGWGQNGQQFTRGKPAQPTPARVYWTQNKHLPSVAKTTVPAPGILPSVVPTSPAFAVCGHVYAIDQQTLSATKLSSSDRAPPSFAASL